jgi:hypothetical protein
MSYQDYIRLQPNGQLYFRADHVSGTTVTDMLAVGNGTLQNGATTGTDGPLWADPSNRFIFDGTNDYISIGRRQWGNVSVTYEAWVRTTANDTTSGYAGSPGGTIFGDTTGNVWSEFGVHGGKVRITRFSNPTGTWQVLDSLTSVNDGVWHHIAGVSAQSTNIATVYVDGLPDNSGTMNVFLADFSGCNSVGRGQGATSFFQGDLADVNINSMTLGADVIARHYSMGIHGPWRIGSIRMPWHP